MLIELQGLIERITCMNENGIDGLCRICRRVFRKNPFEGALLVFCNRGRMAIRIPTCESKDPEGHS
jgi:hypothetical protein